MCLTHSSATEEGKWQHQVCIERLKKTIFERVIDESGNIKAYATAIGCGVSTII